MAGPRSVIIITLDIFVVLIYVCLFWSHVDRMLGPREKKNGNVKTTENPQSVAGLWALIRLEPGLLDRLFRIHSTQMPRLCTGGFLSEFDYSGGQCGGTVVAASPRPNHVQERGRKIPRLAHICLHLARLRANNGPEHLYSGWVLWSPPTRQKKK